MEPESENGNSSPPDSPSASEVHANEELEEGMQRFKNEIDMLQVELLALEKGKIQLPKEVKEQINYVNDLDDSTQSSEDGDVLYSTNSTLEVEPLDIGCKGDRSFCLEGPLVSDTGRKAKNLLYKNHMLQDEIASLRLEIDAVKNQKQEKEKKYFEDTETLQKAMKLKEEILAEETMFQYTGQLNVLRAESAMLNSELENNEQRKQAPETEVESDRSRRAAATPDRGQGQTSQRDLELAFQKANDERLCLQDQMKFDVTKLKSNSETASQQLSKVEIVRQLRQELTDTIKKQSMTEASLEVMACNWANLEDEAQDLRSKLHQLPSQLQEAQDQHIEAMRCAEKTQDLIQRYDLKQHRKQPKYRADKQYNTRIKSVIIMNTSL
ncbi:hypothetical protein AB1E18_009672 [Capra hircus]